MCFSATASFVAGGTLTAIGSVTLIQAKTKKELPFASVPFLFGIQQIIEGVVWLSFETPLLNTITTYTFSIFSHVLWPILIPIAILLLEKDPSRRRMLSIFVFIGVFVGIYLFYFILIDGITTKIVDDSIVYTTTYLYALFILTGYILATCFSSFVSSHKIINVFGIVILVSFFIAGWFFTETLISVWCFFAAILSIIVYWFFRKQHKKQ